MAKTRFAAREFLRQRLRDGQPHPVKVVRDEAIAALGISEKTLQRAAKELNLTLGGRGTTNTTWTLSAENLSPLMRTAPGPPGVPLTASPGEAGMPAIYPGDPMLDPTDAQVAWIKENLVSAMDCIRIRHAILSHAADDLGVSRRALKRCVDEHELLGEFTKEVEERAVDEVAVIQWRKAAAGDSKAAQFLLSTKGASQGYSRPLANRGLPDEWKRVVVNVRIGRSLDATTDSRWGFIEAEGEPEDS
jgi:hypothetical protein